MPLGGGLVANSVDSLAAKAEPRRCIPMLPPCRNHTVDHGQGFGPFKSTRFNQVMFQGVPALIQQRWDADLIEVRAVTGCEMDPSRSSSGRSMCRPVRSPGCNLRFTRSLAEAEPGSILEITGEHFGNTAGPRDPNTIFGVNSVAVGDVSVRVRKWRDEKIEVELPGNVQSGDVVIRMARLIPCRTDLAVRRSKKVVSNSMPMKVLASVRVDPRADRSAQSGAVRQGFGTTGTLRMAYSLAAIWPRCRSGRTRPSWCMCRWMPKPVLS